MNRGAQPARVIRFGVFEADLVAGELRKRGTSGKIEQLILGRAASTARLT